MDQSTDGKIFVVQSGKRYWVTSPRVYGLAGLDSAPRRETSDDLERLPEGPALESARQILALMYLHGVGLEIGALHLPSLLPRDAQVRYVDNLTIEEAARRHPECTGLVKPDVIDDGERLDLITPGSLDFIVANHFLEHTENPLGTLRAHADKLRPGGVLMYTLPDKRFTFDRDRPITPFRHLVLDDVLGPETSRWAHYVEFAEKVDHLENRSEIEAHAQVLIDMNNRIHFHVWDAEAARDMFSQACIYLGGLLRVEKFVSDGDETVTVLKRR